MTEIKKRYAKWIIRCIVNDRNGDIVENGFLKQGIIELNHNTPEKKTKKKTVHYDIMHGEKKWHR